jgi:competence protein ComEA
MDAALFTFLKQFFAAVFCSASLIGAASAAVDVNSADEPMLHTIKGIGPAKAKAIVDERDAHGPFNDAVELAQRVKGLGVKSIEKWQGEGLMFGGSDAACADAASAAKGAPKITNASSIAKAVANAGNAGGSSGASGTTVVRR